MSGFSHPNVGTAVKIKRHGKEASLHFVCHSRAQADELAADWLRQLKAGGLHLTVMGKVSSIVET